LNFFESVRALHTGYIERLYTACDKLRNIRRHNFTMLMVSPCMTGGQYGQSMVSDRTTSANFLKFARAEQKYYSGSYRDKKVPDGASDRSHVRLVSYKHNELYT
jgi:hypothetical protein